jgi:hypothetical protein
VLHALWSAVGCVQAEKVLLDAIFAFALVIPWGFPLVPCAPGGD